MTRESGSVKFVFRCGSGAGSTSAVALPVCAPGSLSCGGLLGAVVDEQTLYPLQMPPPKCCNRRVVRMLIGGQIAKSHILG
jgi:hypothetical protein